MSPSVSSLDAFVASFAHDRRPVVAVDSDGTVFDSMEPKHRLAFTPALIDLWGLHAHRDEVARAFLEINLASSDRGANRFAALGIFFRRHSALAAAAPSPDAFLAWLDRASALSESALRKEIETNSDPALRLALEWSREVNRRCAALPKPHAFIGAREGMQAIRQSCRLVVVSSGAQEAIVAEWRHAGMDSLADAIFTQEAGTKQAVLCRLLAGGLAPDRLVLLGDSPPDYAAAREAGCRFFPIVPGAEPESWGAFVCDVLPRFAAGDLPAYALDDCIAQWERALGAALDPSPQPLV